MRIVSLEKNIQSVTVVLCRKFWSVLQGQEHFAQISKLAKLLCILKKMYLFSFLQAWRDLLSQLRRHHMALSYVEEWQLIIIFPLGSVQHKQPNKLSLPQKTNKGHLDTLLLVLFYWGWGGHIKEKKETN